MLGHTSSHLCSPRSLRGRSEESCCCCCGDQEGRQLSQVHMELQTCCSAKHRLFQPPPGAMGAHTHQQDSLSPSFPSPSGEFPLPRTPKHSLIQIRAAGQREPSRVEQTALHTHQPALVSSMRRTWRAKWSRSTRGKSEITGLLGWACWCISSQWEWDKMHGKEWGSGSH